VVKAQHAYLKMASGVQKPAQSALPALLGPQAEAIGAVSQAKDTLSRAKENRDWAEALSVLAEGVGAFGWVQVEPAPAPFVGEMKDSAQFWVDRVVKRFKDT
jgi:adenylyl cyclase-associated protein